MQPQENPARVLLGLHGNSTERFLLKNLYCLECITMIQNDGTPDTECSGLYLLRIDYSSILYIYYAFYSHGGVIKNVLI